jgi:hypothetical protein
VLCQHLGLHHQLLHALVHALAAPHGPAMP